VEKYLSEIYPVHWLENILKKIEEKNVSKITLATGKTPSGHIHIGILREIIICDSLKKILERGKKRVQTLLFLDDLDAAKRFPKYIDSEFQKEHLGKPFALIPCPIKECNCDSYAFHFGNELISSFKDFGIQEEIIWTHNLYKKKEMQEKIKIALENTELIKEILKKYILPTLDETKKDKFIEMQKSWMPVMAICEKCNRIQFVTKDGSIKPNRVLKYNENKEEVSYLCSACKNRGELSIYSGKMKLNWRVDWPAKWSIFNTTCEPAGKDHCVKGGSYDTGLELCQKVFDYIGPVKVAYEWLRLGEYDMKTSKGIVFIPYKYLEIADPELFRMLILRTNPSKHISLRIEEILQYNDYYEKMENIYFNLDKAESEEENNNFKFMYPLTKINEIPDEKPKKIPLKLLMFLSQVQNIISIEKLYQKTKSVIDIKNFEEIVTIEEFKYLLKRTENWIEEVKKIIENEKDETVKQNMLQKISIFSIPEKIDSKITNKLSQDQTKGLNLLKTFFMENENLDLNLIQTKIFTIAKEELKISPSKLFEAIYQVIFGKKYGPKLGSFLSLIDKSWLLERLSI